MNIFRVDFKYQETGNIPYIVAENEEAAVLGAKLILEQQGVTADISGVINVTKKNDVADAEAAKVEGKLN